MMNAPDDTVADGSEAARQSFPILGNTGSPSVKPRRSTGSGSTILMVCGILLACFAFMCSGVVALFMFFGPTPPDAVDYLRLIAGLQVLQVGLLVILMTKGRQ